MSFVFHFYVLGLTSMDSNPPFDRRAETWEPFEMKLIQGLRSWTLLLPGARVGKEKLVMAGNHSLRSITKVPVIDCLPPACFLFLRFPSCGADRPWVDNLCACPPFWNRFAGGDVRRPHDRSSARTSSVVKTTEQLLGQKNPYHFYKPPAA